jgi:ABC-2 type transport system permease protein
MNERFNLSRVWAMVLKEFVQMKRDRVTFGMMVGIPLLQLVLFGFAINSDPRDLPTAVLIADEGPLAQRLVEALTHTRYFAVTHEARTEAEAREWLQRGDVQFVLNVPSDFTRRVLRGERPALLLEADASDPAASGPAIAAASALASTVFERELRGPFAAAGGGSTPFELRLHRHYNPEGLTQYNIVPGLMGVVLTMTMVVITALAITRERERGTMENLLATPVRPAEVMIGKIIPYVVVGYVQVSLILAAARWLFDVPLEGSIVLVYAVAFLFIAANLAVGITFSTLAKNQLQAVQMAFFFFLPSILLSGFMFPFRGMPEWAQWLGSALPITHFLRIVRGVLLKGSGFTEILPELWPILIFLTVAMAIGVRRYRQTLD